MADLFPSPIPSPNLVDLEEVVLTPEETKIADSLSWTHKFDSIVSHSRTNRIRCLLTVIPFLVNLLAAPGGYDVMERVIDFLSITDFLLLAAAAPDNTFLPFFRINSKIFAKFLSKIESKLIAQKRTCPLAPFTLNSKYFTTLTSGRQLLREYRLFKMPQFSWKIDDSTIFCTNYVKLIEFHPTKPILAMVDNSRRLYIIAYGGEERRQRGQILFVEAQPLFSTCIYRALSWSPNGTYLLAMQAPYDQLYESVGVTLKLCKLKYELCVCDVFFFKKKRLFIFLSAD
jgi:hypothetical protein